VFSGIPGGADKTFRCPFAGLTMGFGHVGDDGGVPSFLTRAAVAGDPVTPVKHSLVL